MEVNVILHPVVLATTQTADGQHQHLARTQLRRTTRTRFQFLPVARTYSQQLRLS